LRVTTRDTERGLAFERRDGRRLNPAITLSMIGEISCAIVDIRACIVQSALPVEDPSLSKQDFLRSFGGVV
jgi:hypothetical protein